MNSFQVVFWLRLEFGAIPCGIGKSDRNSILVFEASLRAVGHQWDQRKIGEAATFLYGLQNDASKGGVQIT